MINNPSIIVLVFFLCFVCSSCDDMDIIETDNVDCENINEIYSNLTENKLNDLYFINCNTGWVIGENSTILHTSDAGQSWESQICPDSSLSLRKAFFVNETVGFIIGDTNTILTTKDGGNNWIIPSSFIETNQFLMDLYFHDEKTGWVVGGDFFNTRKHGVAYKTNDGGQSWTLEFETNAPDIFSSKLFTDITFSDSQNGWMLAGDYVDHFSLTYLYKTINGGSNWVVHGSVVSFPVSSLSISNNTIWVGDGVGFSSSLDGGLTWNNSLIYADSIKSYQNVQLVSDESGYVLCAAHSGSLILYSESNSENWLPILSNQIPYLNVIRFIDSTHYWAAGDSGLIIQNYIN